MDRRRKKSAQEVRIVAPEDTLGGPVRRTSLSSGRRTPEHRLGAELASELGQLGLTRNDRSEIDLDGFMTGMESVENTAWVDERELGHR